MIYQKDGLVTLVYSYHGIKSQGIKAKQVLIRQAVDEEQLSRTICVTTTGEVYYLNHVFLGVIRAGCFKSDGEVLQYFPKAEFQKIRRYLSSRWCFSRGDLVKRVQCSGAKLFYGAALVAESSDSGAWLVSEQAGCIYGARQIQKIFESIN